MPGAIAGAAAWAPLERLGKPGEISGFQHWPVVGDGQDGMSGLRVRAQADGNRTFGPVVLYRVAEQVAGQLLEQVRGSAYPGCLDLCVDPQALIGQRAAADRGAYLAKAGLGDLVQRDRPAAGEARLAAGQHQECVHDAIGPMRVR